MAKGLKQDKAYVKPTKAALERVKLLRRETPDLVEKRQRMLNLRKERIAGETAANHQRELAQLMGGLQKMNPNMQAADVKLRAGKLFKKYHGFDIAPK